MQVPRGMIGLRAEITQQSVVGDFTARFTSVRGMPCTTFVRWEKARSMFDKTKKYLVVSMIQKFNKMSHIRLHDGSHHHVPNEMLKDLPDVD